MQQIKLVAKREEIDRYCKAVLSLLRRVEVTEGDIVIKEELTPVYELLDLLKMSQQEQNS